MMMFQGRIFLIFVLTLGFLLASSTALQNLHHGGRTKNEVCRTAKNNRCQPLNLSPQDDTSENSNTLDSRYHQIGRGDFVKLAFAAVPAIAAVSSSPQRALAEEESGELTVFKTNSGLKYLELRPGTGPSPRYGQLCAIKYTGYMKLPNDSKPKQFDSNEFLIKHGNGRMIPGLDEGIHTMKVGGKRRIIIPPKLGYISSGLGPIPEMPWNRWSLNNLLEEMIKQQGGNLVFEVELTSVIDDEADQGYYEDSSPTPEEFERLKLNFQDRAAAAAVAREAAENSTL